MEKAGRDNGLCQVSEVDLVMGLTRKKFGALIKSFLKEFSEMG